MITFKGNITLSVSEENAGLIPLLVQFNGGDDISPQGAKEVLKNKIEHLLKEEMIIKHLNTYFGVAGQAQVGAIKQMLENGALTVDFTVEE